MLKRLLIAALIVAASGGCANQPENSREPAKNVLELQVEGLKFVGPDEIKSGWVTVRVNNGGGMTHHGLVYRLPDGITPQMLDEQVIGPIQASLTASIEGDSEKAAQIAATIPAWIADITYLGGPGMMSDGVTGEATMYLEPGNYIIECYVKSNGVQHNYSPVPGELGMVLPFTVLPQEGGMAEPDANVTLEISNSGYTITEGAFKPGKNSVRAKFVEQRLYNDFVGHDAHVFRIDADTDVDAAARWPDFFPNDGQQTPAPAKFVGGIHDMPQGSTAYFKLDLEPGEYGITAEVPDAKAIGLFERFSVAGG